MHPFYTVIRTPTGRFTIRYVELPGWTIREQGCHYYDPADARREFTKDFPQHVQLSHKAFDSRILRHEQELQLLLSWSET